MARSSTRMDRGLEALFDDGKGSPAAKLLLVNGSWAGPFQA